MEVSLVPPSEIHRVWPTALPMILDSITASGNRESLDNILFRLMDAWENHIASSLWVAFDDDFVIRAAAILDKVEYPDNMSVMRVSHIGGVNGIKWFRPMYKQFNSFARDNDCDYLEAECIPKWDAFMKRYGAEELSRIYRLPVLDEIAGD